MASCWPGRHLKSPLLASQGRLAEGFQEIGDAAKGAVGSIGDNLKASASSAASDVQSVGESIRVSADLAGQDPEVSNKDCRVFLSSQITLCRLLHQAT